MKTFPDFIWEWIIESCLSLCNQLQGEITRDPEDLPERLKGYIESAQGLIAIVPKLREHPQLEKLVPMKSLISLVWFPSDDYEVCLYCEENKVKYSITVVKREVDIRERKVVAFNQVADEIYACITRLSEE